MDVESVETDIVSRLLFNYKIERKRELPPQTVFSINNYATSREIKFGEDAFQCSKAAGKMIL